MAYTLVGTTVKKIQSRGSYIYHWTESGVDVHEIATGTRVGYASLSNTVDGAVNDRGIFLGTSANGVYKLAHGDVSGDSTASLSQHLTTSSSPPLQSNSITGLAGPPAGTGNALVVANSAGVDYLADADGSTKVAYTGTGCGFCAIGSTDVAYLQSNKVKLIDIGSHSSVWDDDDVRVIDGTDILTWEMKAADSPGGIVTESDYKFVARAGWKAFERGQAASPNYWNANWPGGAFNWVEYEFDTPVSLDSMRFQAADVTNPASPADFKIQGWTGTAYDDLITVTGLAGISAGQWSNTYQSSDKTTRYSKLRFLITAVSTPRDDPDEPKLGEVEFFGGSGINPTAVFQTVAYGSGNNLFLGTDDGCFLHDGGNLIEITGIGTSLNVVAVHASTNATETAGTVAIGTSTGSGGGQFTGMDMATGSPGQTVTSVDVEAVWSATGGTQVSYDDQEPLGMGSTYTMPVVDLTLEFQAPGIPRVFVPPVVDLTLEMQTPAIGYPISFTPPAVDLTLEFQTADYDAPQLFDVPVVDLTAEFQPIGLFREALEGTPIYQLVIEGAADALPDVTIPMASFHGTRRSGQPSYLEVQIPDAYAWSQEILDRPNGDFVIRRGVRMDDGTIQTEEIARAGQDRVSDARGAVENRATITISGTREETTPAPKTRTIRGTHYYHSDPTRRARVSPVDTLLRPGDTVVLADMGDDTFVVDSINYTVSKDQDQMELAEVGV